MKNDHAAKINELLNLTGARDIRELCDFFGLKDASEFWKPVKEFDAADTLCLSVTTLRNYRHLSKGPRFIKHGSAVVYLPLDLHLFNLRNQITLQEVA